MSSVRPDRSRGDRGGEPLPEDVAEAPGGEFYFRPGVLLVLEEELDAREGLRSFLTGRGDLSERPEDGIRRLRVADVLDTLEEIDRRFGADAGVEPDYVFLGSQTLKGGPWDEVEPASPPSPAWLDSKTVGDGMTIAVLDTGIAYDPGVHPWLDQRFTADPTLDRDVPNEDGSPFLASEGGHGTFVAGIASRAAPAAHLVVARVLDARGIGSSTSVLAGITRAEAAAGRSGRKLDLLNLSLGGYARGDRAPQLLRRRIRALVAGGTVVVAAAGNLGSPRPFWPAAMPEVIGVGALDGWGPAPFTNYGPWVDACAPGVDVVSTFFDERRQQLTGADLPPGPSTLGPLAVTFPGYGRWSGTSFAAPKVAGAIAAAATTWGISATAAADRLVRDWRLYRVPDLGVVVNVC